MKTDECGFDAFFRSDHFMVQGDRDSLPGPTDSWITLAGLARETTRIHLGTLGDDLGDLPQPRRAGRQRGSTR